MHDSWVGTSGLRSCCATRCWHSLLSWEGRIQGPRGRHRMQGYHLPAHACTWPLLPGGGCWAPTCQTLVALLSGSPAPDPCATPRMLPSLSLAQYYDIPSLSLRSAAFHLLRAGLDKFKARAAASAVACGAVPSLACCSAQMCSTGGGSGRGASPMHGIGPCRPQAAGRPGMAGPPPLSHTPIAHGRLMCVTLGAAMGPSRAVVAVCRPPASLGPLPPPAGSPRGPGRRPALLPHRPKQLDAGGDTAGGARATQVGLLRRRVRQLGGRQEGRRRPSEVKQGQSQGCGCAGNAQRRAGFAQRVACIAALQAWCNWPQFCTS